MDENKTVELKDEELEKVVGGKIWEFDYNNLNGITKNGVHIKKGNNSQAALVTRIVEEKEHGKTLRFVIYFIVGTLQPDMHHYRGSGSSSCTNKQFAKDYDVNSCLSSYDFIVG